MEITAESLRRLHGIFFPDSPPPVEWYRELALLLQEQRADAVDVIAYLQAMRLLKDGRGRPFGEIPARAFEGRWSRTLGSKVTLVIRATDSETWIRSFIDFYNSLGVPLVFVFDSRTTDATRLLIRASRASCMDISGAFQPNSSPSSLFDAVDTEWALLLSDDELPTPGLLRFAEAAASCSTDFVWGFRRFYCLYRPESDTLHYSCFLPTGFLSGADLQWRLIARSDDAREQRVASTGAVLLNLDWILRPFPQRVARLRSHENRSADGRGIPASFHAFEAVPEDWHMLMQLPDARYRDLARAAWHSTTSG